MTRKPYATKYRGDEPQVRQSGQRDAETVPVSTPECGSLKLHSRHCDGGWPCPPTKTWRLPQGCIHVSSGSHPPAQSPQFKSNRRDAQLHRQPLVRLNQSGSLANWRRRLVSRHRGGPSDG